MSRVDAYLFFSLVSFLLRLPRNLIIVALPSRYDSGNPTRRAFSSGGREKSVFVSNVKACYTALVFDKGPRGYPRNEKT